MKNPLKIALAALAMTSALIAEPAAPAALEKDGFTSLFNGKDLEGWTFDGAFWSVEDGAITGKADGTLKRNHFIRWTGAAVRNFDLRLKVKISAGGNSGIQYRSTLLPEEKGENVITGYQCDIVEKAPRYHGMLYEERGRRILSHTGEKVVVDPAGQPWVVGEFPVEPPIADQWQEVRILVEGNHIRHWIDGRPTADLTDLDEKGRSLEGIVAMQVHVGPAMQVQYKDMLIKHLPDDLPLILPADVEIPADAYGVRPQGKLPSDWKPPVYGAR